MAIGGSAIRAGRAFVELFADDSKLFRVLDRCQGRVKAFGAMTTRAGAGIGAAGGTLFAPLAAAAGDAITRGRDIKAIADRFGIATQTVGELGYAFERSGVGLEEFGGTLDGVASKVVAAADANEELIQGLRGLNGRRLIGMGLDQQLDLIFDAFTRITNPIDQAEQAQRLFGAAGLKMLPFLKQGSAGLRELKEQGAAAGAALSPDAAEKSAEVMKQFTHTWQDAKLAVLEVGYALLPAASDLASFGGQVRDTIAQVRGWIKENRGAVVAVAGVAAALVGAGAGLVGLGTGLSLAATAAGVLLIPLKLTLATLGFLLSPLGLVTAGLVGLGYLFATQTSEGQAFTGELKGGFLSLKDTAIEAWSGITAAIGKGDFSQAGRVALTGLQLAWAETTLWMQEKWNGFKGFFVDGWHDAIKLLKLAWNDFDHWFGSLLIDGFDYALNHFETGLRALLKVAAGVAGALGDDDFAGKLDKLANAPGDALRAALSNVKRQNESDRSRKEDQIEKDASNAQDQRDKDRAGDLAEARNGLAAAREAFKAAVEKAKEPGPADGRTEGDRGGKRKPQPAELPGFKELFAATKGVFSGPLKQQLGYGDTTAKRQLDATLDVKKNTAEAVKRIDKLIDKVENLREPTFV